MRTRRRDGLVFLIEVEVSGNVCSSDESGDCGSAVVVQEQTRAADAGAAVRRFVLRRLLVCEHARGDGDAVARDVAFGGGGARVVRHAGGGECELCERVAGAEDFRGLFADRCGERAVDGCYGSGRVRTWQVQFPTDNRGRYTLLARRCCCSADRDSTLDCCES